MNMDKPLFPEGETFEYENSSSAQTSGSRAIYEQSTRSFSSPTGGPFLTDLPVYGQLPTPPMEQFYYPHNPSDRHTPPRVTSASRFPSYQGHATLTGNGQGVGHTSLPQGLRQGFGSASFSGADEATNQYTTPGNYIFHDQILPFANTALTSTDYLAASSSGLLASPATSSASTPIPSPSDPTISNFDYAIKQAAPTTQPDSVQINDLANFGLQNRDGTWRCAYPTCTSQSVFRRGCDLRKHYNRHRKYLFCRHQGCPQASHGGFSSKKDRDRHEAKHNPGILCEWEGCYRVFSRVDNMKDHVKRIHLKKSP